MTTNPFTESDKNRAAIWDMLVSRDIKAFAQGNWSLIQNDFIEEGFSGIDGRYTNNPDGWQLAFPDLATYKAEWLRQAAAFREPDPETTLLQATILRDIEIKGDVALAHKKFIWDHMRAQGKNTPPNGQTIYQCRRVNNTWKITGFTGYLPLTTENISRTSTPAIQVPANARQHKTAGPYSPVLTINPGKLVVISGQAALDQDGNIIGNTIEEQAAYTLENCRKQLGYAGCGLDKVFKVTVYLRDIADWPRFNEVYKLYFGDPKPVRAAVQTGLLSTMLVEIDLWAVSDL